MEDFVAADEELARYILHSRWIRNQDRTVKPDAFIPPNSLELSVTRHRAFSEDNLWDIGRDIAQVRKCTLYGRADVKHSDIMAQKLKAVPRPLPKNLNHADIINWPIEKDAQKMCALEIARAARFVANPEIMEHHT